MVVNHKIIQRSSIDINSGVKNLTAHNLLSNDDNVVTSAVVALVWYVGWSSGAVVAVSAYSSGVLRFSSGLSV